MRTTNKYTKLTLFTAVIIFTIFSLSCSKILEENPKTVFTTAYFNTPQGIQDAVNAAYADMRYMYLPNGPCGMFNVGTDEWTYGEQPRVSSSGDNLQYRQLGQYTMTSGSSGALAGTWYNSFPAINQCNAIVEIAPSVDGLTEESANVMVAEAKFLRGLYYFNLVTQWGAVPLDLGSGDLMMNTTPFTGMNRLPHNEIFIADYAAMIQDFTDAIEGLPVSREPNNFKLSQAAALHMLAKTYLFKSYTIAAEATDVQNAYDAAMELINNQATYGVSLQQDFADVHSQDNEYNSEIIYGVDRIPNETENNEIQNPETQFDEKVNMANNNFTPHYEQNGLIDGRVIKYQRPLRKIAPTNWLLMECFADKDNDTRYHKSFRTLYRCLSVNAPGSPHYDEDAYDDYLTFLAEHDPPLDYGDTAYYMPDTQTEADLLNAQGVYFTCLGPDEWYNNHEDTVIIMNPALIKFADTARAHYNEVSGRPYPVIRLAETYLIAAETAMLLGSNGEAADLINVLKLRAAYDPGLDQSTIDARYAAIQCTAGDIDLDFILDERSRELCGESLRWADLAVRKYSNGSSVLEGRLVNNVDAIYFDVATHLLRPIPQGTLDAIDDPDKAKYQNPGY